MHVGGGAVPAHQLDCITKIRHQPMLYGKSPLHTGVHQHPTLVFVNTPNSYREQQNATTHHPPQVLRFFLVDEVQNLQHMHM
jgi:hypothetical protein